MVVSMKAIFKVHLLAVLNCVVNNIPNSRGGDNVPLT